MLRGGSGQGGAGPGQQAGRVRAQGVGGRRQRGLVPPGSDCRLLRGRVCGEEKGDTALGSSAALERFSATAQHLIQGCV